MKNELENAGTTIIALCSFRIDTDFHDNWMATPDCGVRLPTGAWTSVHGRGKTIREAIIALAENMKNHVGLMEMKEGDRYCWSKTIWKRV